MTGLDNSSRQLEHARTAMERAGVEFPLVHASAEATGLPEESFDVVFCDFGAMTFTDPANSVPEAARLLLERVNTREAPVMIRYVDPELIIRGSTAVLPPG